MNWDEIYVQSGWWSKTVLRLLSCKLSISKVVSIYTNYLIHDLVSYEFSIKVSLHTNIWSYYTIVQIFYTEPSDKEFF